MSFLYNQVTNDCAVVASKKITVMIKIEVFWKYGKCTCFLSILNFCDRRNISSLKYFNKDTGNEEEIKLNSYIIAHISYKCFYC